MFIFLSYELFAQTPTINFTMSNRTYEEGETVTVTASLSNPTDINVSVKVFIHGDSTASQEDHDFGELGEIHISAGETRGSFTFEIFQDELPESEEFIKLMMAAPLNATLGNSEMIVRIVETVDLPVVNFTFAASTVREGNVARVRATLSKPSNSLVIIPLLVCGTAEYPADHNFLEDVIIFFPGLTEAVLSINIHQDLDDLETDEDIVIKMVAPITNARLGQNREHTITIPAAVQPLY